MQSQAVRYSLLTVFLAFCTMEPALLLAQTSLTSAGKPTDSVTIPVENGFINLADGNLHLDIPFATQVQRGTLIKNAGFVYDSGIWHGVATANGNQWMPTNVTTYAGTQSIGGWRYVDQTQEPFTSFQSSTGTTSCSSDSSSPTYQENTAFVYTDPVGTVHTFPIETIGVYDNIPGCVDGEITDTPSGQNYATDGSGYYATVSNYSDINVFDPSGNQVVVGNNIPASGATYRDTNGNYWDAEGLDDRGQNDVTVTQDPSNPSIYYYDVLTTYAKTARYTVTLETIQLTTNFLAESVGSDFTGSMQVVQSIQLPDGSAYGFTYENGSYGELTGITLPTGGTVSYTYQSGLNGTRAGENVPPRWVSQHVGANGTTNFSIIPTVCGNQTTLLCDFEDNFVTRSGSTVDYTFAAIRNSEVEAREQ